MLPDYKYVSSACMFGIHDLFPVKAINWLPEHLPKGVDIEKVNSNYSKERISIIKGKGKVEVVAWQSAERVMGIKTTEPITLRIRTFNFPGWKAYIDNTTTEIITEKDVGAIIINIPKGKHTVVMRFEDTSIRYYSKIISLISFSCVVFSLFFFKKKRNK